MREEPLVKKLGVVAIVVVGLLTLAQAVRADPLTDHRSYDG